MLFNQEFCPYFNSKKTLPWLCLFVLLGTNFLWTTALAELPPQPSVTHWGRFRGVFRTNDVRIEQIEDDFQRNIRTVLNGRCTTCHIAEEPIPFFFRLPILSRWLKAKIVQGREAYSMESVHMFSDLPSTEKNLQRLWTKLQKKDHPSPMFNWISGESAITPLEMNALKDYVENSQQLLGK